eukprot:c5254_g1_i1 orf=190-1614(-)
MSVPMSSTAQTKVPPGFRFHPTDEELVDYYLKKKVESQRIDLDVIREIDLYKIEPWDLQERCRIGSTDQDEWYFFSHKDKKYPTGTRTNRATAAGFWKATGRDKAIYSKHKLVGMRKTLVFYRGRAPNGQKTDWIMHEYRLENCENGCSASAVTQTSEEGWAVCRVFKKRSPNIKALMHERDPMMGGCCFDDQMSFFAEGLDSPKHNSSMSMMLGSGLMQTTSHGHHQQDLGSDTMNMYHFGGFNMQGHTGHATPLLNGSVFSCKQELDQLADYHLSHDPFMQLPQLESPKVTAPPCYNFHSTNAAPPSASSSNINHVRTLIQLENHAAAAMQLHRAGHSAHISSADNTSDHAPLSSLMGGAPFIAAASALAALGNKDEQVTDWRVLDRLVASQLSQEDAPKELRFPQADQQYSNINVDADQHSTLSDISDKQSDGTAAAAATSTTPPNYNPSNDIELWTFAKRDLASKAFPQI